MRKILILAISLFFLGACTSQASSPTPPDVNLTLVPQAESTSTPLSTPSPTTSPLPPVVTQVLPTPTPVQYIVEQNDTLTGIARKFNIELEELLAANPSVGTQALTVGLVLIIPPPQSTGLESTATPWPVAILQTQCFQNQDGSLWCLALLKNENAETLQNLSVNISLLDPNGKTITDKTAYAPMDLLPSGRSIVVGAFFPAPIPAGVRFQSQIQSASPLPSSATHYPPVHLQNDLVQVDWSGLSATVSGQIMLDLPSTSASRVWILALAYDGSGNVIGFKRWESNETLTPGEELSFNFRVSSLGPAMDHIDLLVEASQ